MQTRVTPPLKNLRIKKVLPSKAVDSCGIKTVVATNPRTPKFQQLRPTSCNWTIADTMAVSCWDPRV